MDSNGIKVIDVNGAINGIIDLFNQTRGQKVVSLKLRIAKVATQFVFYSRIKVYVRIKTFSGVLLWENNQ